MKAKNLLAVCYLAALAFWLCHGAVGLVQAVRYGGQGLSYAGTQLSLSDLELVGIRTWQDETQPGAQLFVSTDNDPQMYWDGTVYLETLRLRMAQSKPAGAVALYYLRPGQADYSEKQKVYATQTGPDTYEFQLGGVLCSGLRLDPDTVGGVYSRLDELTLNPPRHWYRRFLPTAGQGILLLALPLAAAAVLSEIFEWMGRGAKRA